MAKVIYGKGIARLRKEMDSIKNARLEVGFFDTAVYPSGVPVAYVASIHEFGWGPIPARPFMRPAMNAQRATWQRNFLSGFKAVANGQLSTKQVLDQMGMKISGQIKESIQSVTSPALQDSTVDARLRKLTQGVAATARPGSISKPLVATGLMLNSVDYKVTV